jgi:anti-sigma B factor antagonist
MSVESDEGAFRPPRFDVAVSEDPERAGTLLRVSGELDLMTEPELEAALAAVAAPPTRVDLSGLAFMDSTGLRALLSAAREYPELQISGPLQPPVQRLLELTQTLAILPYKSGGSGGRQPPGSQS